MTRYDVVILGAGIVGVTSALELQRNGFQVLLVDRLPPCAMTSYGNAGMLSAGSIVPMNQPSLLRQLPELLRNRSAGIRFDWSYVLKNAGRLSRFVSYSRESSVRSRSQALHDLIQPSLQTHRRWIAEAGLSHRLRDTGWLKLYRQTRSFDAANYERNYWRDYGIKVEELDATQIQTVLPHVSDVFKHAAWIRDTPSVDNPHAIGLGYFALFKQAGGTFVQTNIQRLQPAEHSTSLSPSPDKWQLTDDHGKIITAQKLVVSAGFWSAALLKQVGLKVPMIAERGSHRLLTPHDPAILTQPIYDVDGAYVLTPMRFGQAQHDRLDTGLNGDQPVLRLTTGVHLSDPDKAFGYEQLRAVMPALKSAFRQPIGETLEQCDWVGTRPTLPDSLPMIGETKHRGLYVNTGHQHIGLTTAPESAQILRRAMQANQKQSRGVYSPSRFGL